MKTKKKKMSNVLAQFLLFTMIMAYSACVSAQVNTYDGCKLARLKNPDLEFIRNNAKQISKGKDNCVLALLDTLTNRAIRNVSKEYFSCLGAFAGAGDGYVSEYFLELGIKLFYEQFNGFFTNMYNNHLERKKNPLEKVMIEAISMQIGNSDDRKGMEKAINTHIDNEIKKGKFNKSQLEYLNSVRKKIDPAMFD